MSVTPVTINNNIATDRATAKAIRFVNADNQTVTRLAKRNYYHEHGEADKKFGKVSNTLFKSIPVVAVASSLILGKGIKSAAKSGAFWGMMFAAPAVVHGVDKAIKSHSDNKNAGMSSLTKFALSIGGFFAGNAVINKFSQNKKVNEVADNIISKSQERFAKISDSIKIPKNVTNKFNEVKNTVKDKVKVPEFAKNVINKAKNSEVLNKVAKESLSVGKKALKYSPDILLWGTLAAAVIKGASVANKISHEKAEIKEAQFNTAKDLANKFGEENLVLKA